MPCPFQQHLGMRYECWVVETIFMHCLFQISQDSWSWRGPLGSSSPGCSCGNSGQSALLQKRMAGEAALLQRAVDAAGECGRTAGRGCPCIWRSHSSPRIHASRTKTIYPGLDKGLSSSSAGQGAVAVYIHHSICLHDHGVAF